MYYFNFCFICLLFLLFGWDIPAQNTFTDTRDGNQYKILEIDNYYWFKSDLRFMAPSSWCAENPEEEVCEKSNFYYYHDMEKVCPEGWRIPEWIDYLNITDDLIKIKGVPADSVDIDSVQLNIDGQEILARAIVGLNLISDEKSLNLNPLGWVEGKKWKDQPDHVNLWIAENDTTNPPYHLHISYRDIVMHAHEHHVWDKPKRQRRFAIRCLKEK